MIARVLLAAFLLATPTLVAAQQVPSGVPASAVPATPAPPPVLDTPDTALARDAAEYAKQFAVPEPEARRRLAAQTASVAATDAIAARYRDSLAGIVIEHRPVWRIVVHLTGTAPEPPRTLSAGGTTVPVVFQPGARATRDQVVWAMTWHQGTIRAALPRAPSIGLDPATGELVVVVGSVGAEGVPGLQRRLEGIAQVPVRIRILDQVQRNLAVAGGARVEGTSPADGKRYVCTTGYTVTDGARSAVTTAAHCLDDVSYRDPQGGTQTLEYVGQWGWGYRDVQVNAAAGPLSGLFYADTAKMLLRPVTAARTRASTRAGDFVCHRGERTGYSCALVELTDFAPAGNLCGGPCLPTWVTVAGPTCRAGDSGSPVFSGTTAFGVLKGGSYRRDGSCAFYFYMSVDYLPAPWRLIMGEGTTATP